MRFPALSLTAFSVMLLALLPASRSLAQAGGDLPGLPWQLVSFGAPGVEALVTPQGAITIQFEENGRAGGSGGCNRYGARYTVQGQTIAFAGVFSTRKACPGGSVMEQERRYFAALEAAARYQVVGDQLIIETNDGQRLVFKRPNPLAGSQWQLVAFSAPDAVWPPIEGSVLTLAFSDDGRVAGSSGCNSYGGGYTTAGKTIQFSRLFSTKRACPDNTLMEQENRYLMILGSASHYTLTDDQLIIENNGGGRLVFEPLPPE